MALAIPAVHVRDHGHIPAKDGFDLRANIGYKPDFDRSLSLSMHHAQTSARNKERGEKMQSAYFLFNSHRCHSSQRTLFRNISTDANFHLELRTIASDS